jgi:hypothetical protein
MIQGDSPAVVLSTPSGVILYSIDAHRNGRRVPNAPSEEEDNQRYCVKQPSGLRRYVDDPDHKRQEQQHTRDDQCSSKTLASER